MKPRCDDSSPLGSATIRTIFDDPAVKETIAHGNRWRSVLELTILVLIYGVCLFVRTFAVLRYESVIHEFDPYFNFRVTKILQSKGFIEFWNFFDVRCWYPLGRAVGQTLFPGLMVTAVSLHSAFRFVGWPIDIREVCVFTAPLFSGFTAIAAYLLTKEITGHSGAGLISAIFLGVSPAYMSRSVAGSFDNEAIAIFAMVFAFYLFVKAIHSGTMLSALISAFGYFYMVASWGGYVFITNVCSIYIIALLVLGRLKKKHYVVFSIFYVMGTVLCLNVPFVNYAAIRSSEHMASHAVFILVNAYFVARYAQTLFPEKSVALLTRVGIVFVITSLGGGIIFLAATGRTSWAGRSLSVLIPNYAQKHIPIIASVSEHQASTWATFPFDVHVPLMLMPAGLYIAFTNKGDGYLFIGIYGILAVYFAGVMIRLMLVLAPAAAILSGIALSYILRSAFSYVYPSHAVDGSVSSSLAKALQIANEGSPKSAKSGQRRQSFVSEASAHTKPAAITRTEKKKAEGDPATVPSESNRFGASPMVILLFVALLLFLCCKYIAHAVFAAAAAYSHPSIIFNQMLNTGARVIQDDYREAFSWFRKNTHRDARLLSWWDYGYQTTYMGDRTVVIDNNTWNNTHIATVALALSSDDDTACPILRKLDVDYVFVTFGAKARVPGDDLNKLLWIIRIAGGEYPRIREQDYLSPEGQYRVDDGAPPALYNSLLYRMSYYRFGDGGANAIDTVRQQTVRRKVSFACIEEAHTTENWLIRVYRVKKPNNRSD